MSRERQAIEGAKAGKISRHKTTKSPRVQAQREEESDGGINSHTKDSLVDEIIPE